MSEQNETVVRDAFGAWNAGDMDRLRDMYDPDATLLLPPDWPETGPFVGRDAVMQEYRQLRETFDRDAVRFLSDFESGGDRVIVRMDWSGIGRGPEAVQEVTMVLTVRGGLICGVELFWDHDEARAAANLTDPES